MCTPTCIRKKTWTMIKWGWLFKGNEDLTEHPQPLLRRHPCRLLLAVVVSLFMLCRGFDCRDGLLLPVRIWRELSPLGRPFPANQLYLTHNRLRTFTGLVVVRPKSKNATFSQNSDFFHLSMSLTWVLSPPSVLKSNGLCLRRIVPQFPQPRIPGFMTFNI